MHKFSINKKCLTTFKRKTEYKTDITETTYVAKIDASKFLVTTNLSYQSSNLKPTTRHKS